MTAFFFFPNPPATPRRPLPKREKSSATPRRPFPKRQKSSATPRNRFSECRKSSATPRRPFPKRQKSSATPRNPFSECRKPSATPRRLFRQYRRARRPLAARFQACAGMPCLRDEKIKELTGATLLIGLVFSFFHINFYWHPRVRIRINEREIPSLLEYFSLRVQEVVSVTFDTTS